MDRIIHCWSQSQQIHNRNPMEKPMELTCNCSHGQHFIKGKCERLFLLVFPVTRIIVLLLFDYCCFMDLSSIDSRQ